MDSTGLICDHENSSEKNNISQNHQPLNQASSQHQILQQQGHYSLESPTLLNRTPPDLMFHYNMNGGGPECGSSGGVYEGGNSCKGSDTIQQQQSSPSNISNGRYNNRQTSGPNSGFLGPHRDTDSIGNEDQEIRELPDYYYHPESMEYGHTSLRSPELSVDYSTRVAGLTSNPNTGNDHLSSYAPIVGQVVPTPIMGSPNTQTLGSHHYIDGVSYNSIDIFGPTPAAAASYSGGVTSNLESEGNIYEGRMDPQISGHEGYLRIDEEGGPMGSIKASLSTSPQPVEDVDSDDEGEADYIIGGYHDAKPGTIYKERYRIEFKLGWGHFSTVYMATDHWQYPPEYVAIKFQKSAEPYYEAAIDEIRILQDINAKQTGAQWLKKQGQRNATIMGNLRPEDDLSTGVIKFYDSFLHRGPNGLHMAMVFEPLGPNVLRLMKHHNFKGVPTDTVRRISAQILNGLDFLHTCCSIIHTDLKPENVLCVAKDWPPPRPLKWPMNLAPTYHQNGDFLGPSQADDKAAFKLARNRVKHLRAQAMKKLRRQRNQLAKSDAALSASKATDVANTPSKTTDSPQVGTETPTQPTNDAVTPEEPPTLMNRKRIVRPSCPPMPSSSRVGSEGIDSLISCLRGSQLYDYGSVRDDEKLIPPKGIIQELGVDPNYRPNTFLLPASSVENNYNQKPSGNCPKWEWYAGIKNRLGSPNSDVLLFECTGRDTIPDDPYELLTPLNEPPVSLQIKEKFSSYVMTVSEYLYLRESPRFQKDILYSALGPMNMRDFMNDLISNADKLDYKIVDLGNACWQNRHFSDGIQTRQYRCPEVVVGSGYNCLADLWSMAAMVFELQTGDFLFEPRSDPRHQWSRDEDHLALISELIGPLPDLIVRQGRQSSAFFERVSGHLMRIPDLKYWGLADVLTKRYAKVLSEASAENFSDFLLPMLVPDPAHRANAYMSLRHPWLKMSGDSNTFLAPELRSASHDQQLVSHLRLPERAEPDSRLIFLRQGVGAFPMSAIKKLGLPNQWIELLERSPVLHLVLNESGQGEATLYRGSIPQNFLFNHHLFTLYKTILEANPNLAFTENIGSKGSHNLPSEGLSQATGTVGGLAIELGGASAG